MAKEQSQNKKIIVQGIEIVTFKKQSDDFISLTDIARYKDRERTNYIIQNWMRNRDTIEFLGLWEKLNNPKFKGVEFDAFKNQAGLNSFSLTPLRWIEKTNAVGLISKAGRYGGGIYAHRDIAFEFASWISAEFKLFLIKEFQRLQEEEKLRISSGWDIKRSLAKINYKIHTDAVKENLVPPRLSRAATRKVYANEADVLNVALYGMAAAEWKKHNPGKGGNMRDYSDVTQLVVLANLEAINATLIKQGSEQSERLISLNNIAIDQMKSLVNNASVGKLEE